MTQAFLAADTTTINLKGGWTTIWTPMSNALGGVAKLMLALGVLLVVFAVAKFFWDKRRGGGGQGAGAIAWTGIVGCILAAPGLLFPMLLGVFDSVANAVIKAWQAAFGK